MKKGVVKFWNQVKGYGFIIEEETKKEYYTYSPLLAQGVEVLKNDQHVCFDEKPTDKGVHAINVKPI